MIKALLKANLKQQPIGNNTQLKPRQSIQSTIIEREYIISFLIQQLCFLVNLSFIINLENTNWRGMEVNVEQTFCDQLIE